jgi:hypothetical protein
MIKKIIKIQEIKISHLGTFKGLSQVGGKAKFAENLRPSPITKQLSNETTFSLIHLAGQYL